MRRWMAGLMLWSLPWSVLAADVRSYEGATIIDGNGGRPIADGVIIAPILTSEEARNPGPVRVK